MQDIARFQPGAVMGHPKPALPHHARHDHAGFRQLPQVADGPSVEIGVAQHHVHRLDRRDLSPPPLLEGIGRRDRIQPEDRPQSQHGQQDAGDAEGVGHRVAEAGQAQDIGGRADFLQHLLGGAQRRRVGDGAGKQAEHDRQRQAEPQMDRDRHQDAHDHQTDGQQVERQSGAFEGGEEAGTDLDADAVDEQDQPELPDEVEHGGIQRDFRQLGDMANPNSGEQHAGDAKADTAEPQFTQCQTEHGDKAQHQHDLRHAGQAGDQA